MLLRITLNPWNSNNDLSRYFYGFLHNVLKKEWTESELLDSYWPASYIDTMQKYETETSGNCIDSDRSGITESYTRYYYRGRYYYTYYNQTYTYRFTSPEINLYTYIDSRQTYDSVRASGVSKNLNRHTMLRSAFKHEVWILRTEHAVAVFSMDHTYNENRLLQFSTRISESPERIMYMSADGCTVLNTETKQWSPFYLHELGANFGEILSPIYASYGPENVLPINTSAYSDMYYIKGNREYSPGEVITVSSNNYMVIGTYAPFTTPIAIRIKDAI